MWGQRKKNKVQKTVRGSETMSGAEAASHDLDENHPVDSRPLVVVLWMQYNTLMYLLC